MITALLAKNTDSSKQPLTDSSVVNAFQCKTNEGFAVNSGMSLN